jgi:hypothetical protein
MLPLLINVKIILMDERQQLHDAGCMIEQILRPASFIPNTYENRNSETHRRTHQKRFIPAFHPNHPVTLSLPILNA